jgi:hypothetical protein
LALSAPLFKEYLLLGVGLFEMLASALRGIEAVVPPAVGLSVIAVAEQKSNYEHKIRP